MNRKKKINQTLIKKHKRKNAKLHRSNKPRYISKADRERMASEPPIPEAEPEANQVDN